MSQISYGPHEVKMYLCACADSEDPDQTAHPRSLIRVFAVRLKTPWILQNVLTNSKGS